MIACSITHWFSPADDEPLEADVSEKGTDVDNNVDGEVDTHDQADVVRHREVISLEITAEDAVSDNPRRS
jgi:hypothetical protein